MSGWPRLRRHTDGRVAVFIPRTGSWLLVNTAGGQWESADVVLNGPDWLELLVAQLPEQDHDGEGVDENGNDTSPSQWEINRLREVDGIITAWTNGIEIEGVFYDAADDGTIEDIELDALKLLAAIAEHRRHYAKAEAAVTREQHRAERGQS